MAEVTQIKNGNYIGANKYTVAESNNGKKEITFNPDQVLEEATPVGAEILNEIQKNGLYYLEGTKRVSGQIDIYDCTFPGLSEFNFEQLTVLFKPNANSTNATIQLNINGQIYTVEIAKFTANQMIALLLKHNNTAIPIMIKTSEYKSGKDAEKLFTQEGANSLYKEVETELEKKANLSGATFTGQVSTDVYGINDKHGRRAGTIYYNEEFGFITFSNSTPGSNSLSLKDNGDVVVRANNLTVPHGQKDVVETINWMYNYDQMKIYSPIYINDANAAIYPGTCYFNADTLNTPCTYGQLIAFVNDANAHNYAANWLTQLVLGTDSNIYHRHKVNDDSFTEWSKLYDSSNIDLDVNKLTTGAKSVIGGINELSNRFKNREVIMNTKNGSAGSLLYMNADYRQYSLLVVSAELDGNNNTRLHQQILCVDTSISQQMMSINQWGSPNANSIELNFTSGDGSVRIDNCVAGAIVKIEGIK